MTMVPAGADAIKGLDANGSTAGKNIQFNQSGSGANFACTALGSPVTGEGSIKFSSDETERFEDGETVEITGSSDEAAIQVSPGTNSTIVMPNPIERSGSSKSDDMPFDFETTVGAAIADSGAAPYVVTIEATGNASGVVVEDTFEVTVECGNVGADTYSLEFHRPMDQSTSAGGHTNSIKNGRVVPVKVEIIKNDSEQTGTHGVLSTSFSIRVNATPCEAGDTSVTPTSEYADAGQSSANTKYFRWSDDDPGFWVYNLDTKGLGLATGKCYLLDVYEGSTKISGDQWLMIKVAK